MNKSHQLDSVVDLTPNLVGHAKLKVETRVLVPTYNPTRLSDGSSGTNTASGAINSNDKMMMDICKCFLIVFAMLRGHNFRRRGYHHFHHALI